MCWGVEVVAVSIEVVVVDNTALDEAEAEVAKDEPFETMTIGCFTDDLV